MKHPNRRIMEVAMEQANLAKKLGDFAIGAVVAKDGQVISKSSNLVRQNNNPILHAEIVAIQDASKSLKSRHLLGAVLYTTHEPCPMCTSAAIWAKMDGIVYGATIDDMYNYGREVNSLDWSWRTIDIPSSYVVERGDPKLFLVEGFMREECNALFHTD